MAEHFRDFHDETIDGAIIDRIYDPAQTVMHRFLVRHGGRILEKMGATHVEDTYEGQHWQFPHPDENQTALMVIRDPDTVIPAMLRYGDRALFYTRTGENEPLWGPDHFTSIPKEVDSGDTETDQIVTLSEALYNTATPIRTLQRLAVGGLAPILDRRAERRWSPSTERTAAEIASHYDLSPDIYTGQYGFLGSYMQYSSGLLLPGQEFESLDQLDENKLRSLAEKLRLDEADTLLEVGGGWGGAAIELARLAPNIHITSLTVSEEQLKIARREAEEAGVSDRVAFRLQDYRDHLKDVPRGHYDRVLSVEMIEAVDWRDLDTYFDNLTYFANPERGVIVIQSINVHPEQHALQRHSKSFADTAVFPGGSLTTIPHMAKLMAERGWGQYEHTDLTPSYALTIREWIRNLHDAKPTLTQKWLSEGKTPDQINRFYRGFELYLAFCEAGFRPATNHITDAQLTYRPDVALAA